MKWFFKMGIIFGVLLLTCSAPAAVAATASHSASTDVSKIDVPGGGVLTIVSHTNTETVLLNDGNSILIVNEVSHYTLAGTGMPSDHQITQTRYVINSQANSGVESFQFKNYITIGGTTFQQQTVFTIANGELRADHSRIIFE